MISPEQLNILLDAECKKAFKRLRNPINNRYAEYCKDVQKLISAFHIDLDGSYNKDDAMHKYLLNKLNKDINTKTDELFSFIEKNFDESIDKLYDSCYNITCRSLDVKNPTNDLVKSAIKSTDIENPWSGVHYRDRLKNHNERLKFTIKSNLNSSISRAETFKKNYSVVHTSLSHQLNALDRLFKTEITAMRIQSQLSAYKVNEIAYIKNRSGGCNKCSPYVGKKIKVSKAVVGKNIPPYHPNCKCYIQHIDKEEE